MRNMVCVKMSNGHAEGRQLPQSKCVATRWIGLAICSIGLLGAQAVLAQLPVQPPEPFDPSPIDGETYYFINQLSTLQMDLDADATAPGSPILQNSRTFTDLSQRWATTKAPDGKWKISNIRSGLCLDSAGGLTVQNVCGINVPTQEWTFTYAGNYAAYTNTGNGYNAITNVGTGNLLSVTGSSTSVGAELNQTPLASGTPTGSQLWLFRVCYIRGNDESTGEKEEYDRATAARNTNTIPWWHDAYLPGQDRFQIFKNAGLNAIRIRPASITQLVVHGPVSFQSNGPYTNYTMPAGTTTTFPISATNQVVPATETGGGGVAESDWAGVDMAQRAKKLGMAVFVDLFYDGDNTADVPGHWSTATLQTLEGSPENPQGGTGANLMYNYVKNFIELYRANGAMPDMIGFGNEVNDGTFTSLPNTYTPPTSGLPSVAFAQFAAINIAAMQGAYDGASDTSNPSVLGPPVAPPLRCIDIDGNPDLQTFFYTAMVTYGVPVDNICQSYYPGWHGPLTQAQFNYDKCGNTQTCPATGQHIEEADMLAEANIGYVGVASPGTWCSPTPGCVTNEANLAVGIPIMHAEDGVSYENSGSPLDDWYGSLLKDTPNTASRQIERQYYIDLNTVDKNTPNNLGLGMNCWACEAASMGSTGGVYSYYTNAQLGLFDASTSTAAGTLPAAAAGTKPLDLATLPAMESLGGKMDTTLTYKIVSAVNGGLLESALGSNAAGATLDTAVYNGIVSQHQQWKILSQGGNAEVNTSTFNGTTQSNGTIPMDNLGDGYFQIVNQNQTNGINVLDNEGSVTPGAVVVQNAEASLPTTVPVVSGFPNQEWDIMTVGNCGDIPANCTNPPLTALGDYYVFVNKDSGMLLTLNGTTIEQTAPAAASNGDWIVPSSKGQLWQIVPVHISAASTPEVLAFAPAPATSIPVGGNLGTVNVDVENTARALIETPSESVTLTITGPTGYSKTVTSSSAVASFNLSSVVFNNPGVYTLTASAGGLTSATATFSVVAAPTVDLDTSASVTGSAETSYVATITVTNTGTAPASSVELTTATLGGVTGTVLPQNLGSLAAGGGTATVSVTFPGSAGADNARSSLSYAGTYTGGSFSGSVRLVLP